MFDISATWESAIVFGNERRILLLQSTRNSGQSRAVLVVIFPKSMKISENATIVLSHLVIEYLFYSVLAICMGSRIARDTYLGAKIFIDRTASLILGALGLRLLIGG